MKTEPGRFSDRIGTPFKSTGISNSRDVRQSVEFSPTLKN